jgi:protein-tyrosine phosphatase
MSSNLPSLQQVTNTVLTFARIVKDKSTHAIKTYMNDENHVVERLYPKKNLSEYLYDQMNFFSKPTLVYPNLYLGSMYNALLWQTLVDNNIKYIINVTDEVTNCYPKYIEYYQIHIKDDNNQSLLPYFDESYNKIEEFLNRGDGNVLVHCVFGASRSVTIITEYLRRKTGEPVNDIIQKLKEIRPIINPTQQFIQDLNYSQNTQSNTEDNNSSVEGESNC